MENETIEPEIAGARGFIYSRDEAMRETGWSKATLGRKMARMVEGEHYVYVRGKTRRTPVFSRAILPLAGIVEGVAETDEPVAPVIPENEKNSQSSHNQLTKTGNEFFSPSFGQLVEDALLLPFERILNLKQAAATSGLSRAIIKQAIDSGRIKARRLNPQTRIFKGKEIVTGRMQISFVSLKKFTADYFN